VVPTLFIPISVDAYILPRAGLALAGGGLVAGLGLLAGTRRLGSLRLPLVAVALAAIASAFTSILPSLSLVGGYGRYESAPMRLAYVGLLAGAARLGERERTTGAFLAGCAIVAVEAVYEAATHALPRPDGNLGQPNLLGALLAMAIPLGLDLVRTAARPARRAWLALLALLAAGLLVSVSRSGWLGALAGTCVFAVFLVPRRRLLVALGGGGALLAVAVAVVLLTPVRDLNQDTGVARVGVWRDSLAAVAARPVLGWGEDTLGMVFGRYQTADWEPGHNFDRAHSMPLDLAASQGAVGLLASTWLLVCWWLGMWRHRERPGAAGMAGMAAAYLAWSLLNFDWAPVTALFWLLLGAGWGDVVAGADPAPVARAPATRRRPPPRRAAWRVAAAAALALVGLGLAVPPQVADLQLYAGRPAAAAAWDPLQPHYWAAIGDPAGLRRAAALGDTDPTTYVALGDAETRAGDRSAALAAYRQALERYPYDAEARQRLAAPAGPGV